MNFMNFINLRLHEFMINRPCMAISIDYYVCTNASSASIKQWMYLDLANVKVTINFHSQKTILLEDKAHMHIAYCISVSN